jgi:holo-[acyl-carrier protein] synthase
MIDGVGIDVVDIARFQESLERTPGLKDRLFTEGEKSKGISSLAARFAAKEALAKALHVPAGLNWQDCEIINLENGRPGFLFHNKNSEFIDGADEHLSLSHDAGIASAMVVIER